MPEPLKGKKYIVCGREDREEWGETHTDKEWKEIEENNSSYDFTFEDVKSAVDGLLKSISTLKQPCDKDEVYDLVEKWFEDVIDDAD